MRIIILNDNASIVGGAAQVAIVSANALAQSGFDVTFASSSGPVSTVIDNTLVKVHNFGFYDLLGNPSKLSAAIRGIWDQRCAKYFGLILDDHDPTDTVIHLHTWCKSLSSSVVREASKRGFRLVCTLHDYFTICPNGGLYNYQKQQICTLRPMSMACLLQNCDARSYEQKLWRYARQLVQKKIGGIPDTIKHFISVSDFSEQRLRPYLPPEVIFHRVRNPIDVQHEPYVEPINTEWFTFVGRLSPEKGGHIFAQAASMVGVKTCFIGTGEAEAKLRMLNPDAVFLGWQHRQEINSHLRNSRALIFPSQLYETQGLVVLEAAAVGVPALVSDTCAARDNIVDGQTGLLFRAGDIDDLASKLGLLNSDKRLAASLGKAAYDRYWATPSTLETHVKQLIECYSNVLKK